MGKKFLLLQCTKADLQPGEGLDIMYLQHQHVNQESARAALPGSAEQLCYSPPQG